MLSLNPFHDLESRTWRSFLLRSAESRWGRTCFNTSLSASALCTRNNGGLAWTFLEVAATALNASFLTRSVSTKFFLSTNEKRKIGTSTIGAASSTYLPDALFTNATIVTLTSDTLSATDPSASPWSTFLFAAW